MWLHEVDFHLAVAAFAWGAATALIVTAFFWGKK